MEQCDFDGFVDILQIVAEQYGKKLSDGVTALYWQGLKDLDFVAVKDALGRHLRNTDTGQFMPKIADIRKMLEGSALDGALSAWAKVDQAVRRVGTYQTVVFDDPIIHKVLHDMGGWIAMGTKNEDEWPFVAKEFENRYRGFKARSEHVEYPAKMIGLNEAHNGKEGYKIESPMLIGDQKAAKQVLIGGSSGGSMLRIGQLLDGTVLKLESQAEKSA